MISQVPVLALVFMSVAASAPARPAMQQTDTRELVVLVHGMGRSRLSMLPLARTLERSGFRVLNWGYSSTCCDLSDLGRQLQHDVQARRGAARRVHFVGHSLGNIIVRWALTQEATLTGVGRVVMLAPPNQGARQADRYAPWVGWFLKPIHDIQTDSASAARRVPAPDGIPIGVIAGSRDGKVAVAETHLPGQADHVIVPAGHTFLMIRSDVRALTVRFLQNGRFLNR